MRTYLTSAESFLKSSSVCSQTCSHGHRGCVLCGQIQKEHLLSLSSPESVCGVFSCRLKEQTPLECQFVVKPLCLSLPWRESISSNCVCCPVLLRPKQMQNVHTHRHVPGGLVSTAPCLSHPDERSCFSLEFKVWPHQNAGMLIDDEPAPLHHCPSGFSSHAA